ncbi:cytochrome P450 [Mycena maculata]|uniref:Cytochrome P450 n=1 Tax=Mycena maculata TaxID=230809 RepID=A0AAD7N2I2_9AGAR|nr:cytochrome P450 [Mycena maculata]
MSNQVGLLAVTVSLIGGIFWAARSFSSFRTVIKLIPGPECSSWVYGNMPELLLAEEYGLHEYQWQETYGQVYSIKGCLGETRLMISDPSAIKYILNSGLFVLGPSHQKITKLLLGHGNILLARGDAQRRLVNIMNPCFSSNKIRTLLPAIREGAQQLVDRWESLGFPGNTVDISGTLNDAALDVLGSAILEYSFNSLVGESELARIQRNMVQSVSTPTRFQQLLDAALGYIPDPIFRLACHLPIPTMRMIRDYKRATEEFSLHLAAQKREEMGSGMAPGFVGAFVGDGGAPDQEIGVHVRTILAAGQDALGVTLGWILYKLAQMPVLQQELREEIQLATVEHQLDYNKMALLNAIINEVLRVYSPLPLAERVASADCVLPLSKPIVAAAGIEISEIPIQKGQFFYVAIAAYHRLTSIWGPDAAEFRPSRWLGNAPCMGPALGPHASLLSFFGGPGVCLGWRFAILELQVVVVELVSRFVLSLPENDSVKPRVALALRAETAHGTRELPVHIEHVM